MTTLISANYSLAHLAMVDVSSDTDIYCASLKRTGYEWSFRIKWKRTTVFSGRFVKYFGKLQMLALSSSLNFVDLNTGV